MWVLYSFTYLPENIWDVLRIFVCLLILNLAAKKKKFTYIFLCKSIFIPLGKHPGVSWTTCLLCVCLTSKPTFASLHTFLFDLHLKVIFPGLELNKLK